MQFASIRLATTNVDRLAAFYEALTGTKAARPAPPFAVLNFGGAQLAISDEATIQRFNAGIVTAAANRGAIIEFQVSDVDAARAGLGATVEVVMEPADMPWGNRSMLLRDPDGNAINVFSRPTA
jgi:uncharacterized glyoxalase superfamily protein PhnB